MNVTTKFDIRDRLIINGDSSYVATVQRIMITGDGSQSYEVSWFDASGVFQEKWMYTRQLERIR